MSETGMVLAPQADMAKTTPMTILQIAVTQGADVDKLTRLWELQKDWEKNEARKAYNEAIAKFKANPPEIHKNKHVKFGNTEYNHATLDHVCDEVTKALSAVGITHRWEVNQADGQISVTCILTHEQGHSEATTLKGAPDNSGSKNSIQAIGSAITYLQRYTLLSAVGMAAKGVDNDGAGASGLSEDAFESHMEAISGSASEDELKVRYNAAVKVAKDAGDKKAQGSFVAAKDNRWRELRAKAKAQ